MQLAITDVELDPTNVRAQTSDITGMMDSVAALGILQPIVVRRAPEGNAVPWRVKFGSRRYRAAVALGHKTINSFDLSEIVDATVLDDEMALVAAQAAENMQRAPLEPIDQWRTMRRLVDGGWTATRAAQALGITDRDAKRLEKLGNLHPAMLDLIEECGLPPDRDLAVIALAPHGAQAAALKVKDAVTTTGRGKNKVRVAGWWTISHACAETRIPISVAQFDTATAGVVFTEDFFEQAGSTNAITTREIAKFVEAQDKWVRAHVEKLKGEGWAVEYAEAQGGHYGGLIVPKGHDLVHNGSFSAFNKTPAYDGDNRVTLLGVSAVGLSPGRVSVAVVRPKDVPVPKKKTPRGEADDDARTTDREPGEKRVLDKAGVAMVVAAKTAALHQRINEIDDPHQLLALLVLALGADNVKVTGADDAAGRLINLVPEVIDLGHGLRCDEEMVVNAARNALCRILLASTPREYDTGRRALGEVGSGHAAESAGRALDANSALARFDTPEFLATVSGDTLRALAEPIGIKATKVATLRAMLVEKLPEWVPPGANYRGR